MTSERWKSVVGFEGYYEVSSKGRIRRAKDENNTYVGRILKLEKTYKGYERVTLSKSGRTKRFQVHVIVLTAFSGPCPFGCECNHLDGKPANNELSNLEWVTKSENARHKHYVLKKCVGRNHHNSKRFIAIDPAGKRYIVYGLERFCKLNGLDRATMLKVANRKQVHHRGWIGNYEEIKK